MTVLLFSRTSNTPRHSTGSFAVRELAQHWRTKAKELLRMGFDGPGPRLLELCSDELDSSLRQEEDRTVTLKEAAELSGYTADHIGRLVRQGVIPNAGRKGKPLICLSDLPKRRGRVETSSTTTYDPELDAVGLKHGNRRVG
jgi:hypothetical protein